MHTQDLQPLSVLAERYGLDVGTLRSWVARGHFVPSPQLGDAIAERAGCQHLIGRRSQERLRIMALLTSAGVGVAAAGSIAAASNPRLAAHSLRDALATLPETQEQ